MIELSNPYKLRNGLGMPRHVAGHLLVYRLSHHQQEEVFLRGASDSGKRMCKKLDGCGCQNQWYQFGVRAPPRSSRDPRGCGCQNRFGIPFWLVGEFTHFRTYFSGWIGMFTGGLTGILTHGQMCWLFVVHDPFLAASCPLSTCRMSLGGRFVSSPRSSSREVRIRVPFVFL